VDNSTKCFHFHVLLVSADTTINKNRLERLLKEVVACCFYAVFQHFSSHTTNNTKNLCYAIWHVSLHDRKQVRQPLYHDVRGWRVIWRNVRSTDNDWGVCNWPWHYFALRKANPPQFVKPNRCIPIKKNIRVKRRHVICMWRNNYSPWCSSCA
jgi:hypothetical protein